MLYTCLPNATCIGKTGSATTGNGGVATAPPRRFTVWFILHLLLAPPFSVQTINYSADLLSTGLLRVKFKFTPPPTWFRPQPYQAGLHACTGARPHAD